MVDSRKHLGYVVVPTGDYDSDAIGYHDAGATILSLLQWKKSHRHECDIPRGGSLGLRAVKRFQERMLEMCT